MGLEISITHDLRQAFDMIVYDIRVRFWQDTECSSLSFRHRTASTAWMDLDGHILIRRELFDAEIILAAFWSILLRLSIQLVCRVMGKVKQYLRYSRFFFYSFRLGCMTLGTIYGCFSFGVEDMPACWPDRGRRSCPPPVFRQGLWIQGSLLLLYYDGDASDVCGVIFTVRATKVRVRRAG